MELLRSVNDGEKPEYVFVAGIDTDCCVLKSATDLFENYIMPVVLVDYCASTGSEEAHEAGVKVMRRLIGEKALLLGKINNREDIEKKKQEYKRY